MGVTMFSTTTFLPFPIPSPVLFLQNLSLMRFERFQVAHTNTAKRILMHQHS